MTLSSAQVLLGNSSQEQKVTVVYDSWKIGSPEIIYPQTLPFESVKEALTYVEYLNIRDFDIFVD